MLGISKKCKNQIFGGDMANQPTRPITNILKNLHFECTPQSISAIEILYYMHKVLFRATNELIVDRRCLTRPGAQLNSQPFCIGALEVHAL
jgi:hypothetical protein